MSHELDLIETKGHSGFVLKTWVWRGAQQCPIDFWVFSRWSDTKETVAVGGVRSSISDLLRAPYILQIRGTRKIILSLLHYVVFVKDKIMYQFERRKLRPLLRG